MTNWLKTGALFILINPFLSAAALTLTDTATQYITTLTHALSLCLQCPRGWWILAVWNIEANAVASFSLTLTDLSWCILTSWNWFILKQFKINRRSQDLKPVAKWAQTLISILAVLLVVMERVTQRQRSDSHGRANTFRCTVRANKTSLLITHTDATSYQDLLVGGDVPIRDCNMNHLYSKDLKCSHSNSGSSSGDVAVKVFDAELQNRNNEFFLLLTTYNGAFGGKQTMIIRRSGFWMQCIVSKETTLCSAWVKPWWRWNINGWSPLWGGCCQRLIISMQSVSAAWGNLLHLYSLVNKHAVTQTAWSSDRLFF